MSSLAARLITLVVAIGLATAALVGGTGRAAAAADCRFVLGFEALHAMIPDTVGACLENEQHHPGQGVTHQRTTNGLLVWQKAGNHTAFTDGYRTWISGPLGLQQRLNSEQFDWEREAHAAFTQDLRGGRPSLCTMSRGAKQPSHTTAARKAQWAAGTSSSSTWR